MSRYTRPFARHLRADRPGQAVVEMVLIAPILLLIVMGMVEFARAWSAHHVIADASREGARLSAVADQTIGPDSVRTALQRALANGGLDASGAETTCPASGEVPCIDVADNGGESGEPSTVTIEYPYRMAWLSPLMNLATDRQTITLRSRTIMRNE